MLAFVAVLGVVLPQFTLASAAGRAQHSARTISAGGLHPEAVARTLARVEDEWRSQAATFAECGANMGSSKDCSPAAFMQSCGTVVNAIVTGSSGDQNRAYEYMSTVCDQQSLTGWYKDRCVDIQQAIDAALQFNEYANRMHFNSAKLCTTFWSSFVKTEQKRAQKQRAAEKEMLIKANEQAKALAEKKKQEEVHQKALEAHRLALEARERAAKAKKEAAERLARKKADAAAAQAKVQKAASEATQAADVHRQRLLEHQRAQDELQNLLSGLAYKEPNTDKGSINATEAVAASNATEAVAASDATLVVAELPVKQLRRASTKTSASHSPPTTGRDLRKA